MRLVQSARGLILASTLLLAATSANALSFTFNDVSTQVMDSQVTGFARLPAAPFEITNSTGTTWTDFHVTLVGTGEFGAYPFMQFTDLDAVGIYSGPGTASFSDANGDALGLNEVLTIDGLNVVDGGILSFTADILGGVPEGLTGFDILGLPSVGTGNNDGPGPGANPIPEPSAALLFCVGGAICASRRLRRR